MESGSSGITYRNDFPLWKVILFAMGAGISVANLYYAQPVIAIIAHSVGIRKGSWGVPIGATQVSYALAILFIVALGDYIDRKKIIPIMFIFSGISLLLYAIAANFMFLTISSIFLGCTAVSGQLLIPLTGDLAPLAQRGKYVGIVASGLVIGILSARILSGLFTSFWGWRSIFSAGAVLSFLFALILWRTIPSFLENPPEQCLQNLIISVFSLVRHNQTLYITMVLGAVNFGSFSMFWTVLALLLAVPPYEFSSWQIGLFALIGMISAMAVQGMGRLHDKGYTNQAMGIFGVIMLAGWMISDMGNKHLSFLIAGIIAIDIGSQSQNILNQTRLLSLAGQARSRVNTAYVTGNFIGAALGSIVAVKLWLSLGWSGICFAGIMAALLCIVFLGIAVRRGALQSAIHP